VRGHELPSAGRLKRWLTDPDTLPEGERHRLAHLAEHSKTIAKVVAMRAELTALWSRSTESSEQLLARLQDWCRRAEASGIAPLAQFSLKLKRYA
jgi:stearoyl-CoA desaturase (delta-9 desaturase)